MGEIKHTPGPWLLAGDQVIGGRVELEPICEPLGGSAGEAEANAHLIAAAPEMKEALEAYDEYMGRWYDGPDSSSLHPDAAANWKRVRAALARANGEAGQ